MKHTLAIALSGICLLGTGCRDKESKNPAFMPACFRQEVVSAEYHVPAMTNETIAAAIKYCMEYWYLGNVDDKGRVMLRPSTEICNPTNLQNEQMVKILEYNINNPGFWEREDRRKEYVSKQLQRIGFVSCTCDLETKTVTVTYESSQMRRMNFESLIAQMGLAVNNRPAETN